MADDDTARTQEPVAAPTAPPEAAQESSANASEASETAPSAQDSGGLQQTAQEPGSELLPSQTVPAQTSGSSSAALSRDRLVVARATIQTRKHKKLDKIIAEIEKKGKITNDHVEKLLHVSDATATRYLSELEKEGKIKQQGKTGKAVTYTKA